MKNFRQRLTKISLELRDLVEDAPESDTIGSNIYDALKTAKDIVNLARNMDADA